MLAINSKLMIILQVLAITPSSNVFVLAQPKCSSNHQDRYLFNQTAATWTDARAFCQSLHRTDLAVVNSDDELIYLKTITTGAYWIGLNDEVKEGSYIWTNSLHSEEYSPQWLWHRDEPDNANLFGEHCVRLDKKTTHVHGLSDANCDVNFHYFICEEHNHACTPEMYFSSTPCDISGRFTLHFTSKTWWSARDYCQQQSGRQLVSLETEYDVRYVRQKLMERTDGSQNYVYWVGLNDNSDTGVWRWVGHDEYGDVPTVMDGGRWNRAEPNGGFNENCIQIENDLFGNRGFNDMDCNGLFPFICEVVNYCFGELLLDALRPVKLANMDQIELMKHFKQSVELEITSHSQEKQM
ncbi:uncharacterized protein [Amphiura filiformis]|uniref:uncharacterized protein n=1 Tax=Amphiura filiformis TaxID=82378 RepID=UPI003B210DA4